MSVHEVRRKAKPYVARWRDEDGSHRSRSFATRKEAEAFDASVKEGATVVVALTIDEARFLSGKRAVNTTEIATLLRARNKLIVAMGDAS